VTALLRCRFGMEGMVRRDDGRFGIDDPV